jgi:hypothetical protein
MNEQERCTYINSMATCAMIRAMGMQAENRFCEAHDETPIYREKDFNALIEEYGIHHNAVLTQMRG